MQLTVQRNNGSAVVDVKGRLDAITAPAFEESCAPVVDGSYRSVIIDLRQLEYISSAGLRSLLIVGKKIRKTGGAMSLCVSEGLVRDVLTTANFDSLFPVSESLDQAAEQTP